MADDKSHRAFQRDRTFAKHDRRPWSSIFESSIETKKQTKLNNGHSIEDETIRNLTTSSINISETSSIIEQTSTMISVESMASHLNSNESKPLKPWRKLTPLSISSKNKSTSSPLLLQDSQEPLTTPEPALLGVKQKLVLFEKLNSDVCITITPRKYVETATRTKESNLRRFISKWELGQQTKKSSSTFYASSDELRSEEKKQADYQENELTKAVRVEIPVIVPLQGSSVAINNLGNITDSDEKEATDAGEGKENVITLNSIDIPK